MATRVKCTGAAYRGLMNRYTGKPVTVEMIVSPGSVPMFHAWPRTYSTADVFPTFEDARRMWDREDGVFGTKGKAAPLVCAYSGEPLRPVRLADGRWTFDGGFDPNMLHTREEFLGYMRMRDGVPPLPSATRVSQVIRRDGPSRSSSSAPEPTDDAVRIAEDAARAAGIGFESSTVSMHISGKAEGGGKRKGARK